MQGVSWSASNAKRMEFSEKSVGIKIFFTGLSFYSSVKMKAIISKNYDFGQFINMGAYS